MGVGQRHAARGASDRQAQHPVPGAAQLQAQRSNGRFSADVFMAVEGQDNFSEEHGIVVGGVASHQFSDQGAVYVHPFGVFNATPEIDSDRNTVRPGDGSAVPRLPIAVHIRRG